MTKRKSQKRHNLIFERLMAMIATVNLCLVLFDLSYVPWRDFYLRNLPQITQIYDPIKGIEAHRETKHYLKRVDALQEQVSQTGLTSPEAKAKLEELDRLSSEMVDSNPFAAVNKSGNFEKAKNRLRDRIGEESAKQSFSRFWSPEYLSQQGWNQEINFFNRQIRPLIATNYFRRIGENGELLDNFWVIDLPFVLLFGAELLARSFYLRRRHPSFTWINAILWRWYDLFLLLPFMRWLRIIPVMIRLHQARLLNLQPLQQQINQSILANFAEDLTEIVVVRVINQIQGSIRRGDLTSWLTQKENLRPYIDINNTNEIEAIAGILVKTLVYQVLPKIQPEIIAILRHTIAAAINQTPGYRNFHNIPGVGDIQNQLSEQLATQITTNLYSAVTAAIEDPVGAKLSSQLAESFTKALGEQAQQKHVIAEIQSLMSDFLEEVKLNYVQRLSQEDIDQIMEQTRQLRTQPSVQPLVDKSTILPVKKEN
ncbi:hypothetical protein [Nodularia spumigena]|uniref:hypothetical protein n=1 Tax=Nodularia spumigena TaxID=70799 RepID=UPI00232AC027|nr:hypothetical protein [Nodularia spumigena]MDB9317805.1 hypothetical protein [Nodularia spumigena CS-590/01A]MDB9321986.1 hypothetical protein [Nodularia spumigena CS-591/07A]MDB9328277.1 hypothetical protein [Nodularia spumigena CS-590/02]MDB9330761.1 hypothetical protein [Nodularia spumigena CS-591/04]MDB9336184.1 hypothetical protein [Nodularia spumigena CS-590/01]